MKRTLNIWLTLAALTFLYHAGLFFTSTLTSSCFGRLYFHENNQNYYANNADVPLHLAIALLEPNKRKIRNKVDKFHIDDLYRREHSRIDSIPATERCAAFGMEPHKDSTPRRIFFGSMLADENMDVLKMHAIEVYGIYHVMAFVESNTTHFATPRKMRFWNTLERDLLLYSDMFGNDTNVMLDYWLEGMPDLLEMNREVEQRNTIVKLWKEAGMKERDIGLMADLDEIVSRDFLRALQVCDFPQTRVQPNKPSCQTPKMVLSTVQFESSPLCIKKNEWYHPDLLLGQCIEGIGDPTERIVPLRRHRRKFGQRIEDYGFSDYNKYPSDVLENKRFPLFSGRDIRGVSGSGDPLMNYKDIPGHGSTAAYGVAFHFHNWFNDLEITRNKYATYGHGWEPARRIPLVDIEGDLDLMVRCARDLGNSVHQDGYPYYEHNGDIEAFIKSFGGNRPLYFRNETYVRERHALVQQLVAKDEAKYGSRYDGGNRTKNKK